MSHRIVAAAHPNLALVKYWGKRDSELNIPANSSISVNLDGALTTTSVAFDPSLPEDRIFLNGEPANREAYCRVSGHLDRIRELAGINDRALVESGNDFPTAAGIASSSSAFAALSLAGSRACRLDLDEKQLSILARKGSGSAARSIPGGFVEWEAGDSDQTSFAFQLAPPGHWDLEICTVVLDSRPKRFSSAEGHMAAGTSPFYRARLETLSRTLDLVRTAIRDKNFSSLAPAVEREAISMHAVAITSLPVSAWMSGLYYWMPETLDLIQSVQQWRENGLDVCFTIDAGPNVHLLYEGKDRGRLEAELEPLIARLGAYTIFSRPGNGAWILDE